MKKHGCARIGIRAAAVVFLASCQLFSGADDTGTVTVSLGPAASSRALGDPFFSSQEFPVFSSVTLSVSGPDMSTVSRTVNLASEIPETVSVSLEVPAGNDRVVELRAVPDWTATQSYYVESPLPTFVKAYGGSAVVNVNPRGTTNVALSLRVVETMIVLPDTYTVYFKDSLQDSGLDTYISISSLKNRYYAFDRFGRVFLINGAATAALYLYTNESSVYGSTTAVTYDYPFAYSRADNALYFAVGAELRHVDLSYETPSDNGLSLPVPFSGLDAVAVDGDGFVYAAGVSGETDYVVAKLLVDTGNFSATRLALATYESLGLTADGAPLAVEDMTVRDGHLYIAAGEHSAEYSNGTLHHGKIVEARLSDLAKLREIGWSESTPIPDPSSQFYGPKRFLALAPRKLVVADEGYNSGEVDRVVEVDLDSWGVTGIGLEGVVNFFSTYAC